MFDARMMVGLFAASRYGSKMRSLAVIVWGVVAKTLSLDRADRGLQFGHVHSPMSYSTRFEVSHNFTSGKKYRH
jgi:hypothetical protein